MSNVASTTDRPTPAAQTAAGDHHRGSTRGLTAGHHWTQLEGWDLIRSLWHVTTADIDDGQLGADLDEVRRLAGEDVGALLLKGQSFNGRGRYAPHVLIADGADAGRGAYNGREPDALSEPRLLPVALSADNRLVAALAGNRKRPCAPGRREIPSAADPQPALGC